MVSVTHAIVATLLILVLYGLASFAVKNRWDHKILVNPLKLIADGNGRASLSSAQVFFFTIIVLWLGIYWVIQEGNLISIDNSVLVLLGITVVGSGVGKITDSTRFKTSAENVAWARRKNWIKSDFTKTAVERTPKVSDLLTSDQNFDIARFQALGFSVVIGIALFFNGATAEDAEAFSGFTIGEAYLGLIGISQGAYVGGKYVGSNLYRELNTKLDKVRSLERAFIIAVANSDAWKNATPEQRNMELARGTCAVTEYVVYISAATEAAEIVWQMTGVPVHDAQIQPLLPPVP